MGLHAIWLSLAYKRTHLIWIPSLVLIIGMCVMQALYVYDRIVNVLLQRDYMILVSELYASARDLNGVAANVTDYANTPISYFENYFDPIVPFLNRIFDLTHDPFRLLGFQTLALFSAVVATWFICQRDARLRAFQVLLPSALIAHPSMIVTARADYHTSAIGVGLLLVGSYLFFMNKQIPAFVLLILGTFTKVSFWPSWFMFGIIEVFRRQWRWAAAYIGAGVAAIAAYQQIGRFHGGGGALFFGSLGSDPASVAFNVVFHSELWRNLLLQPPRWRFFGELLGPLGFTALLNPVGLVPTLPLAAFSFLDTTGFRTIVGNTYTVEYLGFLVAAGLIGLARAHLALRLLSIAALTLGQLFSFMPQAWQSMRPDPNQLPLYLRDAEFSACALQAGPALAPGPSWSSYARGAYDNIWFYEPPTPGDPRVAPTAHDPARDAAGEARWQSFAVLVYPSNPFEAGSLADFEHADAQGALEGHPFGPTGPGWPNEYLDVPHYAALRARLPVSVDVGRFRYQGDARLADCARQYGFEAH